MPKLEQEPRLKSVAADVIEWARRVVGAVNPLVDSDATNTATIAAQAAQIAALQTLAAQAAPPGKFDHFALATAPAGWVAGDGNTIGNVGSGATRANVDTLALFTAWWSAYSDAVLPILTSAGAASTRGASAAADWAALKRLTVFDMRDNFVRGASATNPNGTLQAATEIADNGGNSGTVVAILTAQNITNSDGFGATPVRGFNVVATGAATSTAIGGYKVRPVNRPLLGCFKL